LRRAAGPRGAEEEAEMEETVQRTLMALRGDPDPHPLTLERAERAVREVAPEEEDPGSVAKKVLAVVRGRVRKVVSAFLESLGSSDPRARRVLERALLSGRRVRIWCSRLAREFPPEPAKWVAVVQVQGREDHLVLPLPKEDFPEMVLAGNKAGEVAAHFEIRTELSAREGGAFLGDRERMNILKARCLVRSFRPLFAAWGLQDLEGALEALSRLKDGEVRQEGPYVLVREGDLFALRRGRLFDSLALERAFLTGGEETSFSYSEGLEIGFTTEFSWSSARVGKLRVRWGKEIVRYPSWSYPYVEATDEGAPGLLVRRTLEEWMKRPSELPESLRMRALIGELARSENPLEALNEPGFFERVRLRAVALL
jgi:hypothetical protein